MKNKLKHENLLSKSENRGDKEAGDRKPETGNRETGDRNRKQDTVLSVAHKK